MHSNDTNIARMYILYMKISGIKLKMTQIFKDDQAFGVTPVKVDEQSEISSLKPGDLVKISGISKGKGFQGVVKRHGFSGGPKTHGQKNRLRAPGSIGNTSPQRVLPGRRMAGHMGAVRKTAKNIEIKLIDAEKKIIFINGSVPGNIGNKIMISK